MSRPPTSLPDSPPLLSVEEILDQIRGKAAALTDVHPGLVRIVSEHLITAVPAEDAVEVATNAIVALAEQRLPKSGT